MLARELPENTEIVYLANPSLAPEHILHAIAFELKLPAAARILSALARQPLATADMIASRLGITVRAAQMALQQLVSDGVCAMRRTGRAMEFQLQDSAFCEPTGSDVLATAPVSRRAADRAP